MSESYVGYRIVPSEMEDVPIIQRNEHSTASSSESVMKSLESPSKSGVRWLKVSNQSDCSMRYKITIIGVILSILALSVFTVTIAYVSLQSAGTYPWLHDEKIIGENLAAEKTIFLTDDEPTIYKREEFIDRGIYTITSENMAKPRKQDIHRMQKRQAPERTGWRNDPFFTRLHRVETGRKVPREIETIRDNNEFFNTIHSYSDDNFGDGKREIEKAEKIRVCKRSVERCKSVLESMQSLLKTTGDNVESLQQLMNRIQVNEDARDAYPQKYQAFVQCIECRKMTNGDSIKFVNDAEEDESANYNHPVFQDRQSPMRNPLAIAELLNGPTSYTRDVTRRMIEETQAPSLVNEIPGSSTESSIPDSGFQNTTEVSKSLNITSGTKVAYVIKNTTITKQLSRADSPNGVLKPENIQTDAPTGPSAIFNVPGPENNWGWAEATRTESMVEESPSADTSNPVKAEPNEIRPSESLSRSAQFDPRIVTGMHPSKGIYDGNSILLPTAETMKTGQEVQYTPPIPWMPYPVCFYGPPTSGNPVGSPFKQTMPGAMPFPVSPPGSYSPLANQFPQRGYGFGGPPTGFGPTQNHREQGGPFGAGQQFPYGNPIAGYQPGPHTGPTAPGGQGFFPSFGNVPTGPRSSYYCTYMPPPTYQLPSFPGVTEYQRSHESPYRVVTGREKSTDPKWSTEQINYSGFVDACPRNHQRCDDGSNCISIESWCNGRVDCPDVSDETRCSCRDRVNKDRICDGYFDCPRGEDELGCFDCPVNYFSCKNWSENDGEGYCVPLAQRCDGLRQCPNGRDETDCSMLTDTYINSEDHFTIGFTVGYLHKNWQGRWYPVCTPTESWATEACLAETGFALREPPRIRIESTPPRQYAVRYLTQSRNGEIKIVPTCYDKAIYVICPNFPCGTRVLSHQEKISMFGRKEDYFLASTRNTTNLENATSRVLDEMLGVSNGSNRIEATNGTDQEIVGAESRVVGGKASQPKAWPFLVAIRKDGSFNCGGVIITEDWVLTAAHCIDGFTAHYYEIQAGVLRHHSFSPMAQSRRANYIKMHPSYQKDIMRNDLALIKLEEPLLFNRWVRPTCLPKSWPPENYPRREPLPDTACVTAGWGATYEHGPNPDHLREVEVPITRQCKHPEDRNDAEICAGIPQGGRDACQGDSGGPLMCTYSDSKHQWYVAGIVSHGEGCGRPNEPGAYTRVSRFVDWMNNIIHSQENMMIGPKPRKLCPGFSCEGGLGKCLSANERCNGVVDCLDAEDETNCGNRLFTNGKSKKPENNRDYGDGRVMGQVTPGFRPEGGIEKGSSNGTEDGASIDANGTGFTTVNDDIASSTTSMVDHSSEAVTVEVSRDPQPATTTATPQSSSKRYFQLSHFTCTRLIQSLPISKRCNRVIDCEDGTDEDNCNCRDYLANVHQKAICNGHVDCHDGTDEENCTFCRNNEFTCSRSGTCIPQSKMCDRKADCDNMEDELDCFALTNGDHVIIDFDKRPHLNLEGVVTQWQNRTWRPLCVKNNDNDLSKMADQFCEYFGFGSAESAEKIQVSDSPIGVRESTKDFVHPYEYPPSLEIPRETADACGGFYVKCKPILSANTSRLVVTNPLNDNIDYLWPWQASIFVNGIYHCPAILLEHSWLLATSRCVQNLDLTRNYTMALVGMAPTYLHVNGPYQQIAPIDSIKIVEKLDAALLHLGFPVDQTRHVQPIFVQKRIFPAVKTDVCVATGVDKKYRPAMTFLRPVPDPCPHCHRCYKNATSGDCKNETLTNWSGTIVCRGSDTWYPAALFHEKDMLCGFQMAQTVASIDYGNAHFTEVMEDNIEPIFGPHCDGFRCPLGKCVSWARVCDGIDDCRDRSDEGVDYCRERKKQCGTSGGLDCKCSKSELRCASGQCVPKQAFCDEKIDCEDGSDETARCTCADYLRLTAPDRLCNNVRDCLDKSDESSEECPCNSVNFKCSGGINITETCISQDFVCDGEIDCPNAEDEKICRAIQGRPKDPRGTGQILRRSFGMWHSECFAMPVTTTKEATDICRSMNYNSGETLKLENAEDHYGPAMVPERDEFYMIRMNTRAWITLKHNRPLVSLVIARENCNRAFLKCS